MNFNFKMMFFFFISLTFCYSQKGIFLLKIKFPVFILKSNCIAIRTLNQNILMNHCLISNFFGSGNGGAIFIDIPGLSLSINETTFYECISTKGNGGAIFFINGLNIFLFRICVKNCITAPGFYDQFAYLNTNYDQIIDLLSITKCDNLNGAQTLRLANGNQNIYNTNISNNHNNYISGVFYGSPNSMLSKYCTIYNNTVSSYICINLQGSSGNISKSNIILNNSPNSNYGVISLWVSNFNLNECIFDQNKDILLYVLSSTLQLINCYYLTGSSSIIGSVSDFLINKITNYNSHEIYHTYYCPDLINTHNNHSKLILYFIGFSVLVIILFIYLFKFKRDFDEFKEIDQI